MRRGEPGRPRDDINRVTPHAAEGTVPASPEQVHVWLHAAMSPDLPLYIESITIHRHGSFDLAALEASLNEIVRRHAIWRTCFATVGDTVVQRVAEKLTLKLRLIDLSARPADEREAAARDLAQSQAADPFDLTQAPLLRALVVKIAGGLHRLYLTLHHIIFDGVSIYRVLMPELTAMYAAYASGGQPDLAEPTLQYADYAMWQLGFIATDEVARQMSYWRTTLAGDLPELRLPCDRPRPRLPSFRGGMEVFFLPAALIDALKALSRGAGATLYMTLFAAFVTLLHRYSGQTDVVIGGVTDTRRRPELEGLMGYFLNSIALRTRPTANMKFRDLLAHTRDVVLGALAASDVPFDQVVQALNPPRDAGRHPLFQVLFSIEPPAPPFAPGWDLTQMDVSVGASKFDLYLELDERPDGMPARFMFSRDLFETDTIHRMIGHWTTLLGAIAENPDAALGALDLLPAAERQDILKFAQGPRVAMRTATVPTLFAAAAAQYENKCAARCGDASWTYRELDAQSAGVAARLRAAGAGPGILVGIELERGLPMLAGVLGVLRAGGAYLPLDPGTPMARRRLMLNEARPVFLLSNDPNSEHDISLVQIRELPVTASADAAPDDLAYVIYTSGSTGRPNGVEVPHRALVNLLCAMQRTPGCRPHDRFLAITQLGFDIAALELFLPLISGGTVVLATRAEAGDPVALADLIRRTRPTMMQATPSMWRALVQAGWVGNPDLHILCGGEALTRTLADALLSRGKSVWNLYGPTETTIWSTVHRVLPREDPVPIGRAIANTGVYILDPKGNMLPAGVSGELCIGGVSLARGYIAQAALTGTRFVPGDDVHAMRLYRTGDVARMRADGVIEWHGRIDMEVKIRGVRVAPEEVETVIRRCPGIAAAAVRVAPDERGDAGLAAYVVGHKGVPSDAESVRTWLSQHLPEAMLPAWIIPIAALPVTPNGKLDRAALPMPQRTHLSALPLQPRDDTERRLCALWQGMLGVCAVGVQDNFFDLGGHSLLAARLMQRIETEFGRRLPMAALFRAPTVEQFADLLNGRTMAAAPGQIRPIEPARRRTPLLWFEAGVRLFKLAQALGPEQPFIDVTLDAETQDSFGSELSVPSAAAAYVRVLKTVQPHGPYVVGGFCTNGIVAFEAACQLDAGGDEVGLVILVHAVNPVHFQEIGAIRIELSKAAYYLAQMRRGDAPQRWRDAIGHARDAAMRAMRNPRGVNATPNRFLDALERAAYRYCPGPTRFPVALFQPADRPAALDYQAGWRRLVSADFTADDIPGTHHTMLDAPHVGILAAHLTEYLARLRKHAPALHRAAE